MNETKKLTLTGLMTAAVTVATIAIIIPVPYTGGYIHAGDSMIFLSVLLLGWKRGAFAAGVGSALADILSGYTMWAPATLLQPAVYRDMSWSPSPRAEPGSFLLSQRDLYVEEVEANAAGQVSLRTALFDKSNLLANQLDYLQAGPRKNPWG